MVVSPQASPSSSSWSPWVLPQHSWLHRPSMKSCSASPHHKNPKFRSPPARHTQAYITFLLTTRTHTLTGSQVVHAPHLSTIAAQTPDSHRGKSRRDREGVSRRCHMFRLARMRTISSTSTAGHLPRQCAHILPDFLSSLHQYSSTCTSWMRVIQRMD